MAAARNESRIFDCPICLERLKIPKYLPCLHTFCELCIRSFIDSSISSVKRGKVSFLCPVCRLEISPPSVNISAEDWAKSLPLNHLLISLDPSFSSRDILETDVQCDSCKRENEKSIAKFRCKQCRDNLCEVCCRFIHKRVKKYLSHTIVDLSEVTIEDDIIDVQEECLIHQEKPIEVYCFDHEKLCCSICFATEHRKCDTVESLDEIAKNDNLDTLTRSLILGTQKMKNMTELEIQNTERNIKVLQEKKREIVGEVGTFIEKIKEQLDGLHSQLKTSFNTAHEEEISNLNTMLEMLKGLDTTFAESEKIASIVLERGSRRQIFLTKEKVKMQISNHISRLMEQTNFMKRIQLTWNYSNEMRNTSKLKNIGDYKYSSKEVDLMSHIARHFQDIEKEGQQKQTNLVLQDYTSVPNLHRIPEISKRDSVSTCGKLLVAAIDIASTGSVYAFSIKSDCFNIKIKQWLAGTQSFLSIKNPTALLLDPNKKFIAFGYEAKDKYEELVLDEKHKNYYFFEQFEMILQSVEAISRETKLKDSSGKELEAITVLRLSIKFLVDHLMYTIRDHSAGLYESDLKYVISVPTICDDQRIQFIREAAFQAGIDQSSLMIVSEPVAAFCYCRYLPAKHPNLSSSQYFGEIAVGTKFLVADLGYATTDISVLQVVDSKTLRILKSSRGPWGGNSVNDEFEKWIQDIVGEKSMQQFKNSNFYDYLDLMRSFELSKLSFRCNDQEKKTVVIPMTFTEIFKEDGSFQSFMSTHAGKVTFVAKNKLRIEYKVFLRFFESTIEKINNQIRALLKQNDKTVEKILLVNGFAKCEVLQEAVKMSFNTKHVIVPPEAGLSVLKGAIYCGHFINEI